MPYDYFLIKLIVLLLSAKIFGLVFKKINIPPVLGELFAGVILGPSLFNFIKPNSILELLAEIGVVFLLFEVGLHTDVTRLLSTGKKPILVASCGFILPIILGFALARYLGLPTLTALFIGGTLSATSIGITMRVLNDLKQQSSHEAQIVLGAAIADDIFGVLLLSLLYNFSVYGTVNITSVVMLALFIVLFILFAPPIAKAVFWGLMQVLPAKVFNSLLLVFTLVLILLFSLLAHAIHAPTIIGGFVAGISLSRQFVWRPKGDMGKSALVRLVVTILSSENVFFERLQKQIAPFVQIFSPIFFVMVGVALNFKALQLASAEFWLMSLGLLLIALVSKFLSGFVIKEPRPLQTLIGVAMIPRGEVGLIFASLGLGASILSPELYACLILVVALTTFLPPFLLKYLYHSNFK